MKLMMRIAAFVLAAGVLSAGTVPGKPKSYTINLPNASHIKTVALPAGEYKVTVEAGKVRFLEAKSGKENEFVAKVEEGEKKFNSTEVQAQTSSGVAEITEIRIGGSKVRIDFR